MMADGDNHDANRIDPRKKPRRPPPRRPHRRDHLLDTGGAVSGAGDPFALGEDRSGPVVLDGVHHRHVPGPSFPASAISSAGDWDEGCELLGAGLPFSYRGDHQERVLLDNDNGQHAARVIVSIRVQ